MGFRERREKKTKEKYYSLANILKLNADYSIIFSGRSNGKTTAVLMYAIDKFVDSGYKEQMALIRRWDTDFKGNSLKNLFKGYILEYISNKTRGKYNNVRYYQKCFYLCKYDESGDKVAEEKTPFGYAFALTEEEHIKGSQYPSITTILFDEFISRNYYLPEEFVYFQGVLSTIIRERDNVKIFMCGNTINHYCIYFNEMGLKNVKKQKKGTIDLYSYGQSDLKVAVEYADMPSKKKPSNKYFAFNNPKLKMITDGDWEISLYPHLMTHYRPVEVIYNYFIKFDGDLLHCEIVKKDNMSFTFIHRKTTPIKENENNIVFDTDYHMEKRFRRNILKPFDQYGKIIVSYFNADKVFYQDNEVGEIVNNYLNWCGRITE